MKKYFIMYLLMFIVFSNSYASTQSVEKKLLASWGVAQKEKGVIEYKYKQATNPILWVTKPLPNSTRIDYSNMPLRLKPLVIYNN